MSIETSDRDPRLWLTTTTDLADELAELVEDEDALLNQAAFLWTRQQQIRAQLRMRNIDPDLQLRAATNRRAAESSVEPF